MSSDKLLSDIKTLDGKILKKEQEISSYKERKERELSDLRTKRDKAKAAYLSNILTENNLTIDDVQELLGGGNKKEDEDNAKH